jgi:hypothetical protein
MQRSRQDRGDYALRPSGLSHSASQAKPAAAIAGPSRGFISLTRNPALESPERFEPTVKGVDDVVI